MRDLLKKIFAPTTRKSLGNPTDEEIAILSGVPVGTFGVSLATALTVPAVQCAIRLISEAAACLEPQVMRRDGATWTRDDGHPVAVLLADQPNEWSSTFDLVRDLVATALTNDRGGVAWVNRVGGEIREIVRYEPAFAVVEYSTDGRQEPSFKINNRVVPQSDIIHVRGPFARCPLSLAADAIGVSKTMETHAGNLFKNAARPAGIIEMEKNLGDEGFKKMRAAWKAAMEGADNAGKTAILWDGAKFKTLTLDSTDAQFLENRRFQILEIARAFRVPPPMLYDLERATWSNAEQMGREFLVYSLEPWLLAIEGAMRRALFTAEERPNFRVEFVRDDLTRADIGARATAYSSLIASRVLNPNEARSWEGLPSYDGGDSFSNPNIDTRAPADAGTADNAGAAPAQGAPNGL